MELLRAENLSHSFEYPLFDNLNISLNNAETLAILGTSGCGKSTLLHILSTLLKPNSGAVIYQEKSLYEISDDQRLKIRRNDFGIIFQSHYLFKGFSALENIELASVLSGQKLDYELFEKFKIDKILHQKVGSLSGGQQQRVSIARVLSKKPKIIFADELTGNLDHKTALEVMEVIFNYVKTQNSALMFVTHDESLAAKCDRQIRLDNGNSKFY